MHACAGMLDERPAAPDGLCRHKVAAPWPTFSSLSPRDTPNSLHDPHTSLPIMITMHSVATAH